MGGSLFTQPHLAARLQAWHARQRAGWTVLVAGLGELGDVLRSYDERFALKPAQSHALCLEALTLSARLLQSLLPAATTCDDVQPLVARQLSSAPPALVVFTATRFLLNEEPYLPGDPLPSGWDVTTDSIAARIAEVVRADELVLLKSCLPRPFMRLEELADQAYVDRYFPWAMRSLAEVRFVNLDDPHFPEVYGFA
jgi:aspartokinase-like uncharacterized kinase